MSIKEQIRITNLIWKLEELGFTYEEAQKLRRISMAMQRWYELECGTDSGYIERDEKTGKPYFVNPDSGRRWSTPDRETGAIKRLDAIMKNHAHLAYYLQTDPRGACLYILRPGDIPDGKSAGAYYTNGICVF